MAGEGEDNVLRTLNNLLGKINIEGFSGGKVPIFDGTDYTYWKRRMQFFFQAKSLSLWTMVATEYRLPTTPMEEWTEEEKKNATLNAKAVSILYEALSPSEFNRILYCDTAFEIWRILSVTHEGTTQVKENKINMLTHKLELFRMGKTETIGEMYANFSNIISGLKALGKEIPMKEQVFKILRSLTDKFEKKVTAIEETSNYATLQVEDLIGNLQTYEVKLNEREKEEEYNTKKKTVAFRANDSHSDSDSSGDEEALYSKGGKYKGKGKTSSSKIRCFGCGMQGHFKNECPNEKKGSKPRFSKKGESSKRDDHKKKKKNKKGERVHRAAWDSDSDQSSSSSSESESEDCNMALMASVTSDSDEEVDLSTLAKSKLLEMVEELKQKVDVYRNKKQKYSQRLDKAYQTIDDLSHQKDLLELQVEKSNEQVTLLETQNTQLIVKLQHLERQPIFPQNTDELEKERDILQEDNLALSSQVEASKTEITKLQKLNHTLTIDLDKATTKNAQLTKTLDETMIESQKRKNTLNKITQSKNTVDQLIRSTYTPRGRRGLGYTHASFQKKKQYKPFVRESSHRFARITCFSCNYQGHFSYACPMRKVAQGTLVWVPKTNS